MSIAFGFVLVPFWLLIYCLINLEVVSVFSDCYFVLGFIQLSVLVLVYVWFCLFSLVFVSSYVYFAFYYGFKWFRLCFRAVSFTVPLFGFTVPFSNVLFFVCFVFRSGYVPHRNPRGRREKVAGLSYVPEPRVIMLSWDARTRHVFIVAIGDQRSSTE